MKMEAIVEKHNKENETDRWSPMSVMELMACADIVVGDYRTEAFAAVAAEKPLFLWNVDAEKVLDKKEMLADYGKLMPEALCSDEDRLIDLILDGEIPEYQKEFRERYLQGCNGKASKRIIKYLNENGFLQTDN